MVADASLVRPQGVVVLAAVALEHAPRAVVHLHGEVDRQLVLTRAQLGPDAVVETHDVGDRVELREGVLERVPRCLFHDLRRLAVAHEFGPTSLWNSRTIDDPPREGNRKPVAACP